MTAAHELASAFLEGGGRNRRELMTPEGVPLAVDIADYGERAVAFVIDFVLCMAGTILIYLLFIFLPFGGTTGRDRDPCGPGSLQQISPRRPLLLDFGVGRLDALRQRCPRHLISSPVRLPGEHPTFALRVQVALDVA